MSNGNNLINQGDGDLKAIAQEINTAQSDFGKLSKDLSDKLAVMPSKWAGEGGGAFIKLQAAWTERHRTVNNALLEFEAAVIGTDRDTTAVDTSAGVGILQSNPNLNA